MNAVTFDTHAAIRKLQDADLSERQAEALVEVFSNAIGEPITRPDLDAFKSDIRAELAALDARIGTLEARITWRIVLALGAFAALVRLMP